MLYGTIDEELYSHLENRYDEAGFLEEIRYYDAREALIRETCFYACITKVWEGANAYENEIKPGQYLVQLGDWNYSEVYDFSSQMNLKAELAKMASSETELVICAAENGRIVFHRYVIPAGTIGFQYEIRMDKVEILEYLKSIYKQWLKENP